MNLQINCDYYDEQNKTWLKCCGLHDGDLKVSLQKGTVEVFRNPQRNKEQLAFEQNSPCSQFSGSPVSPVAYEFSFPAYFPVQYLQPMPMAQMQPGFQPQPMLMVPVQPVFQPQYPYQPQPMPMVPTQPVFRPQYSYQPQPMPMVPAQPVFRPQYSYQPQPMPMASMQPGLQRQPVPTVPMQPGPGHSTPVSAVDHGEFIAESVALFVLREERFPRLIARLRPAPFVISDGEEGEGGGGEAQEI